MGLGVGLFLIIIVLLLGLLASLVAWSFNKGIPVLAAFIIIAVILILVFLLSPKASETNSQQEPTSPLYWVRAGVGGVLGLGVLASLGGLLISHALTPVYQRGRDS